MTIRRSSAFPLMIHPLFGSVVPYENSGVRSEDLLNAKRALSEAKERTAFIIRQINGVRVAITGSDMMDVFTKSKKEKES